MAVYGRNEAWVHLRLYDHLTTGTKPWCGLIPDSLPSEISGYNIRNNSLKIDFIN